jgi:hypothetical protein
MRRQLNANFIADENLAASQHNAHHPAFANNPASGIAV